MTGQQLAMTPRGWCVCAAAVTSFGVGLLAVEGALAAGGLAGLISLWIARWVARRNLVGLGVERKLPESVFAGDVFRVRYGIRKQTGGASAVRVFDRLTQSMRPLYCDVVGREASVAHADSRIDARGVVVAADLVIRSDFPLGLFQAERLLGVPSRVIVYPRPVVTRSMLEAHEALDVHAMAFSAASDGTDQFRGVREFRPGDPVTRIHWSATARAGAPMVCEFDPPAPQPTRFVVLFHNFSPPGYLLRPRAFEMALSMVAGLLLHGRGIPASVSFGSRVNDWKPLEIDTPEGLREALEILACARYRVERSIDQLRAAILALPGDRETRTYVIGDTPMEFWSDLLPATERPFVCLDTKGSFRKIFKA